MLFHASVIPRALLEKNDSRGAVGAADQACIGAGERGDLLWGLMAAFLVQLLRVGTIIKPFKAFFPLSCPVSHDQILGREGSTAGPAGADINTIIQS